MKTALLALVLTVIAPVHVRLGPAVFPVAVVLAAAEVLAAAGSAWLIARILRRSCSRSFPRLMRSAP